MSEPVRCACGLPLHYTDACAQDYTERMIALTGSAELSVQTPYGTWLVPRHYIALHGITSQELPELAERLGFTRTDVQK